MPGQAFFESVHGLGRPRVYKSCRLAPSSHGDMLAEQNNSSKYPHQSRVRASREVLRAERIPDICCARYIACGQLIPQE